MEGRLDAAHGTPPSSELDSVIQAVLAGSGRTIETAVGLPRAVYTSQAFYDFEVEHIFRKEWLCIGHVSQLAKIGDYFTFDMFGEMLMAVRAQDRIRVMSRACLHRWASVVTGAGNARGFTCPFHNWSYGLDGQLIAGTHMEGAAGFDPKSCRLPEVRTEIVDDLGLIFITFSDAAGSISERLKDLSERLAPYKLKDLVPVHYTEADEPYNWKLKIETGMEAYHHFGTHRNSLGPIYPTNLSWCEDSKQGWTICHSPVRAEKPFITLPVIPDMAKEELPGLDLYHIYPLLRMGVYPDRIRIQPIIPVGPTRTRSIRFYLLKPEVAGDIDRVNKDFTAFFDPAVGKEDAAILDMQQRAAASTMVTGGRLSPLEATVWHLGEYLRAQIRAR
jgi:nitrite reductase/ring-hydroxylating ferredoxin subunit